MSDALLDASIGGWIAEHREKYLADGAAAHYFDTRFAGGPGPVATLLLTTQGRRSGQRSIMPLIYAEGAEGYVIIASRGGDDCHPGWYHNLCARERATVQVANDVFEVCWRIAAGAERAELWSAMVALYPPFADYQAKTSRNIPVIALRRAP